MAESFGADAGTDADVDIDLVHLIQAVFESLVAQAQAKAINLGFEMPDVAPALRTNSWVVKEIVLNLVDNAIRYTPRGGAVTVRLEAQAGQTSVVVEDNGVGIAPHYREKVFDNTDSNGSGLGLAIVRELADHIGAQVQLTDARSGAGLAARVTFADPSSGSANAVMPAL